ncbi:MAG TPA: hypothetical protein VF517_10255 [Thermoleophilaceae bacterium]|jgi:hypothetical protein
MPDASDEANDIVDEVLDALMPNANYWAPRTIDDGAAPAPEQVRGKAGGDGEDRVRYFAGPEALEVLAWIATSVVVPLIVGVASNRIDARLQAGSVPEPPRPRGQTEAMAAVADAIARRQPHTDDRDSVELAEEHVRLLLIDYGWPAKEALSDATEIVGRVSRRLRSQ